MTAQHEIDVHQFNEEVSGKEISSVTNVIASGYKDTRTVAVILTIGKSEYSIWGTDGSDVDGTSVLAIYKERKR